MKLELLFFSALSATMFSAGVRAQVTDSNALWTFMKGNTGALYRGSASGKGAEVPGNAPPARFGSVGWSDDKGNLWLFGGDYNNANTLSDLWKYNIGTGNWTWVNGPFNSGNNDGFNQPTVPGIKGQPGTANQPGSRRGAAGWKDNAGNFWLFGGGRMPLTSGQMQNFLGDLWRYNPNTEEWTWVSGETGIRYAGNYVSKGSPDPASAPRARGGEFSSGAAACWVDKNGDFWMFGGAARNKADTKKGQLNDLWKYSIAANQWTWAGGSDDIDEGGKYGTKGTEDAGNWPGARYGAACWTDKNGNFWMFGGYGMDKNGAIGFLNDLWKYNPGTGSWTWAGGADIGNDKGDYGTPGLAAATNIPSARAAMGLSDNWVDADGKLWMYGGSGIPYIVTTSSSRLQDLWAYDPATNMWTMMRCPNPAGANIAAAYGTTGVAGHANWPGGRHSYARWADQDGNLWLYGGITEASTAKGDLWRLAPILPPAQPDPYTAGKKEVCAGETGIVYTVPAVPGAASYEWLYDGGTGVTLSGGATTTTPANTLDFSASATNGTLRVRAVSASGSSAWRDTAITVNALPAVTATNTGSQAVCEGDSLRLTASGTSGVTYQWKNGTTNVGANSNTYYAKTAGTYTVTVTTGSNCSATSTPATTLTLNALPTVTVTNTGSQAVCEGDSLRLTASGTGGVTYQWKNGTTNVGANSNTYYAKTAGTYTVTVTNNNNCFVTSAPATTLTLNPLPVVSVTAAGPTQVCASGTVTLQATPLAGTDYQWKEGSTPVGTNADTYTAGASGSYKVVAKNTATGCSDSTQAVDVFVYARPSVSLTPGDTSFCEGGLVKLEVQSPDTGLVYRWKNGSATIPLASASFLEITQTGAYTVVVGRGTVTGCEDTTNEVDVTVHPLPAADITWDGVTLHVTPGHTSYQWYNNGQGIAGATDSTYIPSTNSGYSVAVTDGNGCSNTSRIYNLTDIKAGIAGVLSAGTGVSIYPNPARDIVHIDCATPVYVRLTSLDGRTVLQGAAVRILQLDGIPPGVYVLAVRDQYGTLLAVEKLVRSY